jgi:hypothetical protein
LNKTEQICDFPFLTAKFLVKVENQNLIEEFHPRNGSGSFYRKIILPIFFYRTLLTEKSVGRTPFGRTPFDRKII